MEERRRRRQRKGAQQSNTGHPGFSCWWVFFGSGKARRVRLAKGSGSAALAAGVALLLMRGAFVRRAGWHAGCLAVFTSRWSPGNGGFAALGPSRCEEARACASAQSCSSGWCRAFCCPAPERAAGEATVGERRSVRSGARVQPCGQKRRRAGRRLPKSEPSETVSPASRGFALCRLNLPRNRPSRCSTSRARSAKSTAISFVLLWCHGAAGGGQRRDHGSRARQGRWAAGSAERCSTAP